MYRKYILILCTILFVSLCNLQAQSDGPTVSITTDKGCGDEAQFTVGEKAVFLWKLTGAENNTQYGYEMTVYAGTVVLNKWQGEFETDSSGNWSDNKPSIISLPLGAHEVKIEIYDYKVYSNYITNPLTAKPRALTSYTCVYYVAKPECSCDDVVLTASLDRETVTPGDTCTLTITADKDAECAFTFNEETLLVDLGELGGIVFPLKEGADVDEGTEQITVTYVFAIPTGSEGLYRIGVTYHDEDCLWNTYVYLTVKKEEPKGTISVLSLTTPLETSKSGYALVKVTNPSQETTTYTVKVSAPSGIRLAQPTYSVQIGGNSSKELRVSFITLEEGTHTLTFELQVGDQIVSEVSSDVKVNPEASLEIISPPLEMKLNDEVNLKVKVKNASNKDIIFQVSASASEGLQLVETNWQIRVDAGESEILNIPVKAVGHSPDYIDFELLLEGELIDSLRWNVTVEDGTGLLLPAAIAAALLIALSLTVAIHQHGRQPETQENDQMQIMGYVEAGNAAEQTGDSQGAAENYENAADLYRKIGKVEKAVGLYKQAEEIYRQLNLLAKARETEEKAAKAYEEAGLRAQENGEFWKAADYFEKAADLWKKAKNVEKPMELYEKASELLRQTKNLTKAREVEEKAAESYEKAGTLAYRITEFQRAAELSEEAADRWRETGRVGKAIELYEKAAELWRKLGNAVKAKETEEKTAILWEEAGINAQKTNEFQRAAEFYRRSANSWRKTGNERRAKEVKEKTAALYEEAGLKVQEIGEFQKAADYFERAADLWRKIGNESKARTAEEKALEAYGKASY